MLKAGVVPPSKELLKAGVVPPPKELLKAGVVPPPKELLKEIILKGICSGYLFLFGENMNLYYIDKEYVQYLKNYESKVEDVNYGNRLKPHLGIILKVNNYNYYVPLSSPKKKHLKMHNMPDFLKILDKDNKLLAVLNLNNMIPVPDNLITLLNSHTIDKFRSFNSQEEKSHYIDLLKRELKLINELNESNRITQTAQKLYRRKQQYPNDKISKRCCDFNKLELLCLDYNKENY